MPDAHSPVDLHDDEVVESPAGQKRELRKVASSSQSFTVLTYLVLGVVFCWTPIMVLFTLSILNDYWNNVYYYIGSLLYYSNALLDPIFFTMAIAPLRTAVYRILHLDR